MEGSDWCEAKADNNKTYYYNKKTKETRWTKPEELQGADAPAAAEAKKDEGGDGDAANNPAYWRESTDPSSGRKYYYNKVTKKTTWKKPACWVEGVSASGGGAGGEKKVVKDVWKEATDPKTGRTYWYNKASKKTTWKNPFQNQEKPTSEKPASVDASSAAKKEASEAADAEATKSMDSLSIEEKEVANKQALTNILDEDEDDDEGADEKFKFAKHRKGWFNRTFRVGEVIDDSTLLTFKKSLISKALLKQNRDLDAEAIQCFKNVMSYMGDRKSSKEPIEHAKKMLRNLMQAPATLRDEVYMQLCKQTTQNPRTQSTIKGWELMLFCICSFPPSKHLKTFLLEYITKTVEQKPHEKVTHIAEKCLEWLPNILKMGQRKQVPSKLEIECLTEMKPVPIKVMLCNGAPYSLLVNSYTLVSQVENEMMQKLNLTCTAPFGLFEQADVNEERILEPKDRVLDCLAAWENRSVDEAEAKEVKKKAGREGTKFDKHKDMNKKVQIKLPEYRQFLFKAKLVLKTSNNAIMADPEAVNLIHIQAVSDVVTNRYPANEKDMTLLAALQLQATYGDFKAEVHKPGWLAHKITEYIPQHLICKPKNKISETLVKEWEVKILAKYEKVAEFTSLDAKLNYLDFVQEWTFYGATFFLVKQMQFKDYPSPLILGINSEGVLLMNPENKTMLENYAFTDIVTWGHSDDRLIVVVGNIVQQRKLMFKTNEGKHMNHLIYDYVKFKVKSTAPKA